MQTNLKYFETYFSWRAGKPLVRQGGSLSIAFSDITRTVEPTYILTSPMWYYVNPEPKAKPVTERGALGAASGARMDGTPLS